MEQWSRIGWASIPSLSLKATSRPCRCLPEYLISVEHKTMKAIMIRILSVLMLALKSGTSTDTKILPPPDIIMAAADETGAWADAGAIQPVSSLLDSPYIAAFDPNALSGANYKNQLWGTPISYGHTLALYYNK